MKKYLLSTIAIVLAIAASAYTAPIESNRKINYDWVSADGTDLYPNQSRSAAIVHYNGCNTGSMLCAKAFVVNTTTEVPSQNLKHN